jgi:hypothetical protein
MPASKQLAMQWKKLGRIFSTPERLPWMISHSANPTAEHVNGSCYRVYFNCRDAQNKASIASFDFDVLAPEMPFNVSEEPIVSAGPVGTFDDSGISMGCIQALEDGSRYLYYIGWNLSVTVPWRNSIGLAIAKPGSDVFEKYAPAPIVDRSSCDPFSLSYPWVLRRGERDWLMWYGSNLSWGADHKSMLHVIKFARSSDGIHWQRDGKIAIDFKDHQEYALSRPCVQYDGTKFRMWYSFRGDSYRIGYAESSDGESWTRMDEQVGIDVSESGWDSDMINYACVFEHQEDLYMLYNGNDYGRSGIGLAVLEAV